MTAPEQARDNEGGGDGLKESVLRGGRLLVIRQVLGLVVSVGGMLTLTRVIGPSPYGVYAAAFGLLFFAQTIGELSLDVYVVRYAGQLTDEVCHQVFTLLVVLAVATTAIMLAATPLIAAIVDLPDFVGVALVLFASIPLVHLQQVPLSRLERGLDYGSIGLVEVVAQIAFFAVALPLAVGGAGVWAPVAGWWTQQLVLLAGLWWRDDYRPRLLWRRELAADAVGYGIPTVTSVLAYRLRDLVNPLLVGGTLGASAIGYVALAGRLIEQLGFLRMPIMRMSFAVLSRVSGERDRLKRALTQATELQMLAVGAPLVGFAILSGWLIPAIFGEDWRPVAHLLPLLVPTFLAMATFSLQSALMMTQERPWDLVAAQGASAVLLWIAAAVLVPHYGVVGYGYAELVAMASWLLTDRLMARRFPRPAYTVPLVWWAAFSAAGLAPVTSWWLLLALPLGFALPWSVRELRAVAEMVLQRRGPAVPVPVAGDAA